MSEQNKPPFILSDVLPEPNEYSGFVKITSAEFENTEVCDIRDIIAEHFEKKQIEEMARDICECYGKEGICYQDDKPCDLRCEHMTEAQFLYNRGYRKERQGEWKFRVVRRRICDINHAITCSNCGFDIEMLQGKRYNYCPNCGAKMKGAE